MIACSLNEITSQTIKAARAAGYSWGQADDIALAVRRLCEFRLPGVASATAYFESRLTGRRCLKPVVDDAGIRRPAGDDPLCPLDCGIAFLDLYGGDSTGLDTVVSAVVRPLLFLPFAQIAAQRSGRELELEWMDARVVCEADTLWLSSAFTVDRVEPIDLAVRDVTGGADRSALATRTRGGGSVNVDADVWRRLARLAVRTYVPASEASRMKGAGAGLVDND